MKILAHIIACIALGTILGMAFWLCDGGKSRPMVSEGREEASLAQEILVKVYKGVWHENYLEVIK